jgi:Cu2+-exporting ATPase
MFVFFLSLGRYIEMRARHKLSGSGRDVQALLPSSIEVQRTQGSQVVPTLIKPIDVVSGDQIQLRQGAIVPFDARITGGAGQFDESLLTGEALAINKCVVNRLLVDIFDCQSAKRDKLGRALKPTRAAREPASRSLFCLSGIATHHCCRDCMVVYRP